MVKCNMKTCGSVDSIETFGLVDGPGIRTVVFLNGCMLRCKYCHNPEMWSFGKENMAVDDLVTKLIRNKPYFRRGQGGVTFSGGEPLLQVDFLIAVSKKLKEQGIHVALDTAGVGVGRYEDILQYVDLVILDIKHLTEEGYKDLVGRDRSAFFQFVKVCQSMKKPLWIRHVVVPGVHDNDSYMNLLVDYLKTLDYIEKIEFIPYHKLGSEKYEKLGIENPYVNKEAMNEEKCQELYQKYIESNFYFR